MARDPDQRYSSASAMADDLVAWQETRPVNARNGHLFYRIGCLVRRHRALSLVLTLATLVLIGGAIWTTWQLAAERDLARAEADRAEQALAEAESALAPRRLPLRDFLVGLFQGPPARADRATQLPSTEDLSGRRCRARAGARVSAPADERFGMLSDHRRGLPGSEPVTTGPGR